MPPIKVLSWNVESFGDAKGYVRQLPPPPGQSQVPANPSELINFVARVITQQGADIVGLMEVKAGIGATILPWLTQRLNNNPQLPSGVHWEGRVSARQDGGTKEEYLFLWRNNPNQLTINGAAVPGPFWSSGVVDDSAMASFYASMGWQGSNPNFLQGLVTAKLAHRANFGGMFRQPTTSLRVVPATWSLLSRNQAPAGLASLNLNHAQQQTLGEVLLKLDILRFTANGDRPPFFGSFLVGAPGAQRALLVGLFHALGPGDPDRLDAANILGMISPAQTAANLLLMGDFNVDSRKPGLTARVWQSAANAKGVFSFHRAPGTQPRPVFDTVRNAPLFAGDLLHAIPTTLVNGWLADTITAGNETANAYDNFFFRGGQQGLVASQPHVVDLLNQLYQGQHGLGQSALTFFRVFRGPATIQAATTRLQVRQAKLNKELTNLTKRQQAVGKQITQFKAPRKSTPQKRGALLTVQIGILRIQIRDIGNQLSALNTIGNLINNQAAQQPTGLGTAHAVYRHAVSDHLPIMVTLT